MAFDTSQPAQMQGIGGTGDVVDPLVTIGDPTPTSNADDYLAPGIPDGMGAIAIDENTIRLFVNHELTNTSGYAYTLENGAEIVGARVSYFDIDKTTRTVVNSGLAYDTIYNRAGEVVTAASDLEFGGLNRFCSAQLVPAEQFGEGRGLVDSIFFTGEETGGGTEFALNIATGELWAVPWMGRAAWESVTELDTGTPDKVALLVGDDREAAPLLLYVGEKETSAGAGFLERNGLANGKLYAWVPDEGADTPTFVNSDGKEVDTDTAPDPFGFNGTGSSQSGTWVELDYYRPDLASDDGSTGYDAQGFATQAQQDDLFIAVGGFQFSRPEDVSTNPEDGTVAVMASTGRGERFAEDNWGTTYKIDVAFSESGDPLTAQIDILYDGDDAGAGQFAGPDFGLRSPDNLDWADDGHIYIQEDRSTAPGSLFGGTSGEEASIWKLNPETGELTRIAQMNRNTGVPAGQTDGAIGSIGNWESSGIIDVSTLFGEDPGELFLFNVQAHSLRDGIIADADLVEGGQIAFLSSNVAELEGFASLPADTLAEGPDAGSAITGETNGRTPPFAGQPVQGFSGVQFAPGGDGSAFWFLSDNGFGSKVNSPDYLLRLYQVDPNFVGAEAGDGSVEVQGFVQLSDPNNLIPFDIVNEGTPERNLTGADFDIESFVIDGKGDIWIGEEFGPYILHFDATGALLEAPIPTPNIPSLNTLNGQEPLVIGHRGASGLRPEHTLASYQLAMEQGADFVEPDLVITKDGVLIARHEPLLSEVELDTDGTIKLDAAGNPILKSGTTNTTNVAEKPEFADRIKIKNLDGVDKAGWWAEDFTIDEIKTLSALQSRDYRDQSFNDQFEIPTLKEVIELVQQFEADTGKKIGIYPETKHPTFFEIQGFSLEEPLIETLKETGFTDPNRIFIQSFEVQNLIELQGLLDAEDLGDLPLVQLYGDTTTAADPTDPFSYPYDIRYNVEQGNDLAAIYGQAFLDAAENPLSADTVYADLDNTAILQIISDKYAEGAGPWKENILLRQSIDPKFDGDGDGVAEIGTQLTGEITSFIEDAHDAGLQVHPYTLRDEERFLTLNADGTPQTPADEFEQLIQIGADGFFTDFPATGDSVRDQIVAEFVRSPDNPAVLAGDETSNLSRSRGYEGMAFSPDRMTLYPMLEGTVLGDPEGSLRIYEFDVASSVFEGLVGLYQMEAPSHAIGDFTPINTNEFLVIERDGGQAAEAEFKKIFKVNLSEVNEDGFVNKQEVVDLLSIDDPNDLNGDGSTTFTFPFVTIEDVLVLDEDSILVANDNNYPFSVGRGPDIDNNEIIEVKLAEPLDLDPRLGAAAEGESPTMSNNHVIFIHPDGTSPSHYALARFVQEGPDGRLNWDELEHAGVYLGHMEDQLGGTSNGGAVTHATGAKVYAESFGFEQDGSEITPLSGNTGFTIVEEAIDAGKVTALVQSGAIFEPGTAAFVAETGEIEVDGRTVVPRGQTADIAKQVIESGVDFILAGGEVTLLPVGTDGFHGTAEEYDQIASDPIRRPSENLIELAESLGYTVVYTRDQLYALLDQAVLPQKVLGVFAPVHTFNDRPEEVLAERDLPLYLETAPTIAEMLDVTQQLMEAHPNFKNGSIAIVEEEGTDNFGNNNNAAGVLEGVIRADAAIGVARDFLSRYENTLIITAADSDAGGLQVRDPLEADEPVGTINNNPTLEDRPVPLDGVTGANTLPFESAPDVDGDVFPFGVAWAGTPDFPGSIVSKAEGLNADKLPATVDNTGIYELMYETLFDVELASRNPVPTPAPEATADTGNVIFIHPDGTSPSHYMALRNIEKGPDGRLNWDMMSDAGVYLGHMENQLTGTSNGGAVTHANGVKVFNESFGLEEDNSEVIPASGNTGKTILEEAIEAGKATALIQSGHIGEPGTAAFAAATQNRVPDADVRARDKTAEIAEQVIRSGVDVIMAGGEVYLLPQGTTGFHVTPEIDAEFNDPVDRPTSNLIELAESLGYTVVYTEDQLNAAINSDAPPEKLLGVFAANHTFDDRTEEELGLNTDSPSPLYVATAPTVAEMLEAALKIIGDDPDGFFAVVEEEGTDNFANNNNAVGTIEAMRRADAAIGVAMDYVDNQDPNTLVVTAADSDAGGMQVFQFAPYTRPSGNEISEPGLGAEEPAVPFIYANPTTEQGTPVFLDGPTGSTGSAEFPWDSFPSMDSIDGPMGNFGIAWTGTPDVPGSIVSKAYGLNADKLPATLDNTFIYELMYETLGLGEDEGEPKFNIELGNFSIGFDPARVSDDASGFFVADTVTFNTPIFDITHPGVFSAENGILLVDEADLLVSPELANALGDESLIGVDVGDARTDARFSGGREFVVDSGVTSVSLDTELLGAAAGLELAGADSDAEPAEGFQVGFDIVDETDFTFTTDGGFTSVSGSIEHEGSVFFNLADDPVTGTGPIQVGLYDAANDKLIQPLQDGATIALSELPNGNLTIAAFVVDDSALAKPVESIVLDVNDGFVIRTENFEPYSLFGDIRGDFSGGSLPQGNHTITFDLYSEKWGNGRLLETVVVDFTLA